ncbi:DUF4397 domain-containing protein [Halobacterium sp. R2-5]|uniref:DUF4397 domain-containing protein n=1 Tax=Halobacterium sp. R2-5 TaxID=2715751 RepID=UPI001423908E|nr:DUF4397 domain-containing protein [Halobacterium sp. R2-5]NIB98418.1 DUF4397 domain-containing protein [Halobacterium sp. R2-5]
MDTPIDRRRFVRLAGAGFAVALAGCTGGDGDAVTTQPTQTTTELAATTEEPTQAAEEATEETTGEATEDGEESTTEGGQGYVRAAHASPDAPAVDVYVNDALAFEEASYTSVTPYAQLPPDDYDVRVTAAGDESTVVFEDAVAVESGYQTAMAYGEAADPGGETGLTVSVFADDAEQPGGDEALVRVFNGAPDASTLTAAVEDGGNALVDGAAFGAPTDYVAVSPGSYALNVRSGSGDTAGPFDVTFEGGDAYSVLALGYVDASGDQSELELVTVADGGGSA